MSSCEDVGRVSGPRLPKLNIEANLVLLAGVRVLPRVVAPLPVGGLCLVVCVESQFLSRCSLILLFSTSCSHIGLHSRLITRQVTKQDAFATHQVTGGEGDGATMRGIAERGTETTHTSRSHQVLLLKSEGGGSEISLLY